MRIYNLSDHPSKTSQAIRLKGGELPPGQSIEAEWDPKLATLEILAVGSPPKWYTQWKDSLAPKEVDLAELTKRFEDPPKETPKEIPTKKK